MGLVTLAEYRTDVDDAMGSKGYATGSLDRWINYGLLDLAGAVKFDILENNEAPVTVSGQEWVTAPTNTLVIELVRDDTNNRLLAWIDKTEYFRRSQDSSGEPTHWTRHNALLYLHPVPDGAYTLFVATIEPPAALTTGSETSPFPDTWDSAIFMLAVHHGLLAKGQEQRSAVWLARAITYIASRITEADFSEAATGVGASIPRGLQSLTARLQGLGGE